MVFFSTVSACAEQVPTAATFAAKTIGLDPWKPLDSVSFWLERLRGSAQPAAIRSRASVSFMSFPASSRTWQNGHPSFREVPKGPGGSDGKEVKLLQFALSAGRLV